MTTTDAPDLDAPGTPPGGTRLTAHATDERSRGWPSGVDQVPLLGAALEAAQAVDRAVARLLSCLMELDEHQVAEAITGIPLEQWLAIVGRRTRSDRQMLLTACEVLRRLPSLRIAFLEQAVVSWAQVRVVALRVQRLPRRLDDVIDGSLAATIDACRDDDPDALSAAVSRALASVEAAPSAPAAPTPQPEPFLAIQPRLDGTGGSLHGELDAVGLATVDAALSPGPEELRDLRGPLRGAAGRERARRLVNLCDASLRGGDGPSSRAAAGAASIPAPADRGPRDHPAGGPATADGTRADGAATSGSGSRPQLLVRVELATLLEQGSVPGELLTRLTGGKLWADAATVRRLADERGADLRTIVLDGTGRVVGVGRRTRVPPGWLREAILALHDTCSAPGCLYPARSSEIDHAVPWTPPEPGTPRGRTDVDQLAPLCRRHNRDKEPAGWRVDQTADGVRRWDHPGTGLSLTTRPATWRVPPGVAREQRAGYHVVPMPEPTRAGRATISRRGPPRRARPLRGVATGARRPLGATGRDGRAGACGVRPFRSDVPTRLGTPPTHP